MKYLADFFIRFIGKLTQVAELINFLALMNGQKYARRDLAEALLKVDLQVADPTQTERYMSFQYTNILVVWCAVGRSLTQLLPFFDFSQMKKLLKQGADSLT